jgi:hypothetical protein
LLGPNVPRSGIWWPNTYLAKYPIYSYLFFYGYSVDTYQPRMQYVSVRDTVSKTYPQAERRIRAEQTVVVHREWAAGRCYTVAAYCE